jgi:hypothetical protein
MAYRLEHANSYFVGTFLKEVITPNPDVFLAGFLGYNKTLIGFVVGTCSNTERLEHENMFKHDPHGSKSFISVISHHLHSFPYLNTISNDLHSS